MFTEKDLESMRTEAEMIKVDYRAKKNASRGS